MNRKVKVGLVGASARGGWASVAHIPALRALDNIELAAICSSSLESAKAASSAYGVKRAYHDLKELVNQPDIDIISTVVKIPDHYDVVKAAIEAGKHVYCEWPLGARLQETEELTNLANEKKVVTTIGLQGHYAPELLYIKKLYSEGWFGDVVTINITMQTRASSERSSHQAWEDEKHRKATLFTICGGHTLYYLYNCFGSVTEVSGQLTTQISHLTLKDSGEQIMTDIPDQIIINGLLESGIPFTNHISAVPFHSKGWRMEVYGTKGTIIATSAMLPQITPIKLIGSQGDSELSEMQVPKNMLSFNTLPGGPPGNVGRNYGSMAEAIIEGRSFNPNFEDALAVHKLLDSIEKSSNNKQVIQIK